jgi:hypothetical protein
LAADDKRLLPQALAAIARMNQSVKYRQNAAECFEAARIRIPDSKLAREIMELVRDTEPPLLFHHS